MDAELISVEVEVMNIPDLLKFYLGKIQLWL